MPIVPEQRMMLLATRTRIVVTCALLVASYVTFDQLPHGAFGLDRKTLAFAPVVAWFVGVVIHDHWVAASLDESEESEADGEPPSQMP